jgi:hypothetical protein
MRLTFGTALGGTFLAIGVLFAAIDSVILFKGWGAYGLDWADKLSYGLSAASIPWVVAGYPFVWWVLWLRGRWRAVFPLAVAGTVYAVLIVYSLIGAMGSIATQRSQVIAEKSAAHDSLDALKSQRDRYRNELGWIQKHRPPAQIEADVAKEKIKRQWEWTEGCRDIRSASQRSYCTSLQALQGELAAARKSEEIHIRIDALSRQIDGRAPVSEKADPMAATLVLWLRKAGFQVTESEASIGLPITTPIILLIGEMVFVWFGFMLLGIDHKRLIEVPQPVSPRAAMRGAVELMASPMPAALPPPADPVTRGRELASWFFSECTRPVPSGGLPEGRWYALYGEQCTKSNSTPIGLEEFRALAKRHGAVPVLIDGQWHYQRVLPLVPKEGAA